MAPEPQLRNQTTRNSSRGGNSSGLSRLNLRPTYVGVLKHKRVTPGPTRIGARFDLVGTRRSIWWSNPKPRLAGSGLAWDPFFGAAYRLRIQRGEWMRRR